MSYNVKLEEVVCDLPTEQHACARTTYVSCLRGEHDYVDLHSGHGRRSRQDSDLLTILEVV